MPETVARDAASALPPQAALDPAHAAAPHDWKAVDRHLRGHGFALDAAFAPRRFAGGLANLNYLVRLESGDWAVLRRPPPGPLPPGAHDMAREHRILSTLWKALPLAPRSFHLCADPAVAGAPFQLLEYRSGISVRGDSLAPFSDTAATGAALSDLMVAQLAALHAVDPASIGLQDLGKPDNFMARAARGWTDRAARVCPAATQSELAPLAEWLGTHTRGVAGDVTLLHNDFKLDNLLLDPVSMAPVAILDWDMGTRGDALFDLATHLSYWTEASDPECMHRLRQMPTARPGFKTRAEAAAAYSRLTGRSLDGFKVYRVLAMFKLGVVFHQLHSRYRTGEVTDPRYAAFDELADGILRFTRDIAADHYF